MILYRSSSSDSDACIAAPYELPDAELVARFWASVWGKIARETARPDDPAERKKRDPLVHALLCKFIHTHPLAGGLGSVWPLDDATGLRELRAELMRQWPQEVKADAAV